MLELDVQHCVGNFELRARFASSTPVTAFFGRSGAGKSTLVNIIAGLIRPARGSVRIGGNVLFDSDRGINVPPCRRRIGYVFQEGRLFPHLNIRQNLLYGRFFARSAEQRVTFEAVVDLLGLAPLLKRRPGALSGGEKQRIAIGRALLSNPRLLLMDEPLASLDEQRKKEILRYVETLRDQMAIPIVYVSHAVPEIVRLAETVVVLHDGRVIATGGVSELLDRADVAAAIDPAETGAAIEASVVAHDDSDSVSRLQFDGGELFVTRLDAPLGATVRVYVRARDIALALERPVRTSLLNILMCRVSRIDAPLSQPTVDVQVSIGGAHLTARISRRSHHQLGLHIGQDVFALVKAVAVDRGV